VIKSSKELYPFADLNLARRLETTEARGAAGFVEARAKAFPDRVARWINIAGTYAMYDGVGSPMTQTFGLGMLQPITSADMDALERFFQERGAGVFHEVCPLADPSALALLNDRGYRPLEFTSVMYRPIDPEFRLQVTANKQIRVRRIQPGEEDLWAQIACRGWSEFTEVKDLMAEIGQVTTRSAALSFIAELEEKPIATGALIIADGVSLLAGASTIPEARRQGAQLAMLEGRLGYAVSLGCTVAMMCASPGSGSQRNAERHGFRIAYTRVKWQLPVS
jgi:hypothetical protein